MLKRTYARHCVFVTATNSPIVAGVAVGTCAILAAVAAMSLAPMPEQPALGSRSPTIQVKGLQEAYNAGEDIHTL